MNSISVTKWEKLNDLIYHIYHAQSVDELRRYLLQNINTVIEFDRSFFDLANSEASETIYFNPMSFTIEQKLLDQYYSDYIYADYVAWMFSLKKESFIYRDSDIVSDTVREQSTLYQEWLLPMDVYYICGINIVKNNIPYGSITLFASKQRGDYEDETMAVLAVLARQLSLKFSQLFPTGIKHWYSLPSSQLQKKYNLTNREEEVLRWLCTESSIEEIATNLFISEHTVRKHAANIYKKTRKRTRAQLIALIALEKGNLKSAT